MFIRYLDVYLVVGSKQLLQRDFSIKKDKHGSSINYIEVFTQAIGKYQRKKSGFIFALFSSGIQNKKN